MYDAGANLQFNNPGYRGNAANNQGAITNSRSDQITDVSYPALRTLDTPLAGTIWISGLVRAATDTGSALLWLEPNESGNTGANSIGFFEHGTSDAVWIKYNNVVETAYNPYHSQMDADHTYLYLAKIEMNYSAEGYDRVTYWIKNETADLSSESALGTPLFSRGGADALGATLTYLGVSFNRNDTLFDALRVGDSFLSVIGVPEPSSGLLCLIAAGLGAAFVSRGRRGAATRPSAPFDRT